MLKKYQKKIAGLFYGNNGIVYTEDEVPVYTLYLGNIHNKTEAHIQKHFSSFGEVESVKVHKKVGNRSNDSRQFQYGFVTFTKPEYAARALNSKNHLKIGKRVTVKAADSWKQPKSAQKQKSLHGSMEIPDNGPAECSTKSSADKPSILELNDDCLRHIFSFIGQNERLKLSFVCQRFYEIVEHCIRVSKHLDLSGMLEDFTLMEMRSILSSFGEHIRRLRLCRAEAKHRRYIEFIAIFCRNLEEIHFEMVFDVRYETYKRILHANKKLKILRLRQCEIRDNFGVLLSDHQKLEILDLSHNYDITGLHLHKLRSLKDLNLSKCLCFSNRHFTDICQALKLKALNIVGCRQLGEAEIITLISTQTELESLAFGYSLCADRLEIVAKLCNLKHIRIYRDLYEFDGMSALQELPAHRQEAMESLEVFYLQLTSKKVNRDDMLRFRNLKKLSIAHDSYLDDSYLSKIGKTLQNIEDLNIAGSCVLVTEMGITKVVDDLKKLRRLNISHCRHISYSLVSCIYKILKSSKGERTNTLAICAFDTGITSKQLEGPGYRKYRELVTVTFDFDPFEDEGDGSDDYVDGSDDGFSDVLDDIGYDFYDRDEEDYDFDDLCYEDAIVFL